MDITFLILYLYSIIPISLILLLPVIVNQEWYTNIYWTIIPYDYRPHQLWYRIICFLWYKHNIIKCRYLDARWNDRDKLLLHSMMEVLSQFIEKECSPGDVDWYDKEWNRKIVVDGHEKFVRDELQDIYIWWHIKYNKEYPYYEDLYLDKLLKCKPKTPEYKQISQLYYKFQIDTNKETKDYCHRLINVMDDMWT